MRAAWIVIALVACHSDEKPPPPPPTTTTNTQPPTPISVGRDALLAGELPERAPEMEIVNAKCRVCHSVEYLTQQRLGEAGWKKTIEKMRKFGASLTDAEIASLVAFATRYWNPELPGRTWVAGPPPTGALPLN